MPGRQTPTNRPQSSRHVAVGALASAVITLSCSHCGARVTRAHLFLPCAECGRAVCHPDSKEEKALKYLEKALQFVPRCETLKIELLCEE